jgi:uncharacterized Zn finger protein
MTEQLQVTIESGRITGHINHTNPSHFNVHWSIPTWSNEQYDQLVRVLAEDFYLYGRLINDKISEEDKIKLLVSEQQWSSSCDCGSAQPCRHAHSVIFAFRQMTKSNPWLWFQVLGAPRHKIEQDILAYRCSLINERRDKVLNIMKHAQLRMDREFAAHAPSHSIWNATIATIPNPSFWNRDISFAAWLLPIYQAANRGEEQ